MQLHNFVTRSKYPKRYVRKPDFMFQRDFTSGSGGSLRSQGHYLLIHAREHLGDSPILTHAARL